MYKAKKVFYGSFYEDGWFLNSSASVYFILFESDFVNMTLGNYGQVETANSKAPLFIVASGTVLIEHENLWSWERDYQSCYVKTMASILYSWYIDVLL